MTREQRRLTGQQGGASDLESEGQAELNSRREFVQGCADMALSLGVPRVGSGKALEAVVSRLLRDPQLTAALQEDVRARLMQRGSGAFGNSRGRGQRRPPGRIPGVSPIKSQTGPNNDAECGVSSLATGPENGADLRSLALWVPRYRDMPTRCWGTVAPS